MLRALVTSWKSKRSILHVRRVISSSVGSKFGITFTFSAANQGWNCKLGLFIMHRETSASVHEGRQKAKIGIQDEKITTSSWPGETESRSFIFHDVFQLSWGEHIIRGSWRPFPGYWIEYSAENFHGRSWCAVDEEYVSRVTSCHEEEPSSKI